MPEDARFVLMVMGAVFILLGFGAIRWGKSEEKVYYDSLTSRPDTREFLEHWPQRPQFAALKIGGWIAIVLGTLMVLTGGALWIWG